MSSVPGFYLRHAMEADAQPEITSGGSGFFSAPNKGLDPHLFDGKTLRLDVRQHLLSTLYQFWNAKYSSPHLWSTVWLAGSGISYQWSANRGNGDLDVLIGVDFPKFFAANHDFSGIAEPDMASLFNEDLHKGLWPKTANDNINEQTYEVTFYVNAGSTDIRDINPYAAYNVTRNSWTVKPPELPQDPHTLYPQTFWNAVDNEESQAKQLIGKYKTLKAQAGAMAANSPGQVNALTKQQLVVSQAKALYDSIHLGRRMAFSPGGSGYGDYYNFRWQVSKQRGYGPALNDIEHIGNDASEHQSSNLYGAPIKGAAEALTEASLWNTPFRRTT